MNVLNHIYLGETSGFAAEPDRIMGGRVPSGSRAIIRPAASIGSTSGANVEALCHQAEQKTFGSACLIEALLVGTMHLDNNDDLYEFLLRLTKELQAHGEAQLAKEVIFASHFASGSASEFLHEAQYVLTRIEQCSSAAVTPDESRNLRDVIMQIDNAFRKIGGA